MIKNKLHLLPHAAHARDGQVWIHFRQCVPKERLRGARTAVREQHDAADVMRAQLDLLHQLVLVMNVLRQRDIEHGAGRPLGIGIFRVAHNSDDAEGAGIFRHIQAKVFLHRVLVRKEPPHEGFVHQSDRSRVLVVSVGETPPAYYRLAQCLQIAGADSIPGRA